MHSTGGPRTQMVPVNECLSVECPVSVMAKAPHMEVLAKEALLATSMFKSTGAFPQGNDSSKWDVLWYDSIRLMLAEDAKVKSAIEKFTA